MANIVETRTGRVQGAAEEGLVVFRGIPFAAPPTGERRFRPPEPMEPWGGVRPADRFGAGAPQRGGVLTQLAGGGDLETDEDCLTLNVWTPACDASRRPVLIWIHGGGYTSGSSSLASFDGASLARRGGVVVASLNYRLGTLGFLGVDPETGRPTAGNNGLRDQLAGLEWLRDHVERFGGDPNCITVFGESAGSMSLGVLLAAPAARGLFARAILQSGAPSATPAEEGERVLDALLEELGLTRGDGKKLADVPAGHLLDAQEAVYTRLWRSISGLLWQPVVDDDLVPSSPRQSIVGGAGSPVQLVTGTNLDECRYWAVTDPKSRQLDDAGLLRRCTLHLGEAAASVIDAYRAARKGRASVAPSDLWFAIETDRLFRVPTAMLAESHARHHGDVYHYLFDWASPALDGSLGSCHALEIPFVFGTHDLPAIRFLIGEGAEVQSLSATVQDAWIAFAREGAPGADWPRYDSPRRATRILGAACRVQDAPFEAERRIWDGLL